MNSLARKIYGEFYRECFYSKENYDFSEAFEKIVAPYLNDTEREEIDQKAYEDYYCKSMEPLSSKQVWHAALRWERSRE